ncbi:hypothetical protein [Falsibacillus albus]|uniref:Dimethylamine monooxygenase subunit DmmA-like C-terminal domain-containing protein n=1 Tax=Falsibacillus albus TaxID=2478915 RepID=A0A3L7JU58_9BACI|nr:hypothetical protein [Falsibacillus albus]RLQ93825.1 hypothetical protein D9X91_16275 [Falsibacillus albus]
MNKKAPSFISGKRKYIVCGDEKGIHMLTPIIQTILREGYLHELVEIGENASPDDLIDMLGRQKMGTYLYLCLSWGKLNALKDRVRQIGFSDEEAQFHGHGEKDINVFCCRCHGITTVGESGVESGVACKTCQLILDVSDHYAPLKDAYLGYPATV